MDNKTKKEIGFSMNEIDSNTILIEGVVQGKVSKKSKVRYERQFSKVALHLFDKDYVERLQQLEIEIVNNDIDFRSKLKDRLIEFTKILMK